jgi:hypothetical protein
MNRITFGLRRYIFPLTTSGLCLQNLSEHVCAQDKQHVSTEYSTMLDQTQRLDPTEGSKESRTRRTPNFHPQREPTQALEIPYRSPKGQIYRLSIRPSPMQAERHQSQRTKRIILAERCEVLIVDCFSRLDLSPARPSRCPLVLRADPLPVKWKSSSEPIHDVFHVLDCRDSGRHAALMVCWRRSLSWLAAAFTSERGHLQNQALRLGALHDFCRHRAPI